MQPNSVVGCQKKQETFIACPRKQNGNTRVAREVGLTGSLEIKRTNWKTMPGSSIIRKARSTRQSKKLPNAFGLYDVYGNEWEWCHDYYDENYYTQSPSENPIGPEQGNERVRRGGGFQQPFNQLTSYTRGRGNPVSPSQGAFRIVREVNPDGTSGFHMPF